MYKHSKKTKYLLYDNECSFCSSIVDKLSSIIDDTDILFMHLNSNEGKKIIKNYKLENMNTVIYIDQHKQVFIKSKAILKLCKHMRSPYNMLYILNIFPNFILNIGYDFIAKHRRSIKI